jgi:peroxiredoxin
MVTFCRILLSAVILVLALSNPAGAFFHKRRSSTSSSEDIFKKLMIEKPATRIQAPDFTLQDLSGKRVRLQDLRGKVVFLNFWATWCPPCRLEMPTMEKLHLEFKEQGLEVVAVNIRESEDTVRQFVDQLGLSFTVLLDRRGSVSDEYGAWSIPITYIIDRRGDFVGKAAGYREWDSREAQAFFRTRLAKGP